MHQCIKMEEHGLLTVKINRIIIQNKNKCVTGMNNRFIVQCFFIVSSWAIVYKQSCSAFNYTELVNVCYNLIG